MNFRNKLTILAVAFVASISVAPFAVAQTNTDAKLGEAEYNRANAEEAFCVGEYKDRVYNFTAKYFKAIAMHTTDGSGGYQGCMIVDSTDSDQASFDTQSRAAREIEQKIRYSKEGITEAVAKAAINQANKDKEDANALSKLAGIILSAVIKALTWIVFQLTALAGLILSWALEKGTMTTLPPSVHQGWVIVRDVFNMFFILVLIVMSLATILRREEYSYRRILLKLILMALLINFSEVIAVTLIRAADTVAMVFAKDAKITDYFNKMYTILKPEDTWSASLLSSSGVTNDVIRAGSGFVLSLVMMSAYLAIALLLVVRYVGLYLLIVIAPAAFALYIFPPTQKYFYQWRDHFIKYLVWLPIAIFFMRLGNLFFENPSPDILAYGKSPDFTLLIIAGFYWGAFYITKSSGVYGAQAVAGWSKGTSAFLGKVVARGTAAKLAGTGLEHVPGLKSVGGFVKTGGDKWQKVAQNIEAAPGTVKHAFNVAQKDYDKGVAKQGRAQRRLVSRILPFDTESMEKDDMSKWDAQEVENVIRSRIESGKISATDLPDLVGNLNRKAAIAGLVKMYDKHVSGERKISKWDDDPAFAQQLEEALNKKAPYRFKLQKIEKGDKASTGYYFDGDKVWLQGTKKSKKKGETPATAPKYTTKFDATDRPTLSEFLSDEEETQREKGVDAMLTKRQRTEEARIALEKSGMDAKTVESEMLRRATIQKDVYSLAELGRVDEILKAEVGDAARVDLDPKLGSVLGKSGQRVYLSSKVAQDPVISMELDESRFVPKEQLQDYVKVLKETHEMSEQDINRMVAAAEQIGGIEFFRGVERPFSPILSEKLPENRKIEVKQQVRTENRFRKEAEGSHALMNFLKRSNSNLYRNIVNKITTFDEKQFSALEAELRKIENYKDLSRDDIAEEIAANHAFRSKLPEQLQKELDNQIGEASATGMKFRKARMETARVINSPERVAALASKWEKRQNQSLPDQLKKISIDGNVN